MNIPNLLTSLRIILVPIYLIVFFSSAANKLLIAGFIFILAGISDMLDGYIARKYDMTTKLGTVLDPLADKLMTFAVLISLTYAKLIPQWILIALGLKEVIMIAGGAVLYLFKGNQVLPSNQFGKVATIFFYGATLTTIFQMPEILCRTLFLTTVFLNVIAFINYFLIYLKMGKKTAK